MKRFLALLLCLALASAQAQVFHGPAYHPAPGGGGGTLTVTNLANNVSTSNGFSTGSLTWAANSIGVVCVASAQNALLPASQTVTGGSETWSLVHGQDYSGRRRVDMFVSDTTPTNGALTITLTVSGGSTYQESQWSVEQLTNVDTGTPVGTGFRTDTASGTSLNLPDLGTIDAGDVALFCAGFESGADSLAVAAGSTQHILRQGGGNVRSLIVGTSTADDTPGITWATDGNGAAMVGAIFNTAP